MTFEDTSFIKTLTDLTENQRLVHHARIGCEKHLKNEGFLKEWKSDKLRIEFWCHSLVFKHGLLSYPFIETKLRIFHKDSEIGDCEVGYYRLITTLDGKIDDDYFVIYESEDYLAYI